MTSRGKKPGTDEVTVAEVKYMRQANRLARIAHERSDIPVGSVVICGEGIVGEDIEAVRADKDLTAHAEIRAVQEACRRVNTFDLAG